MDSKIYSKLDEIRRRYIELEESMSSPDIVSDHQKLMEVSRSHSMIEPLVERYNLYEKYSKELKELESSRYEDEFASLVKEEISTLKEQLEKLEMEIKVMLLPKDPNDEKNVIVEMRAGAGGDEASIFVSDMYRAYVRYIESLKWKYEPLSFTESSTNGFKEIAFVVKGEGAYSRFKFESGVHRVQRVPKTESSGRIHTSTITVAVLPEAEEVDISIDPKDLKVDVYRSSGAGGQSVNTTDSAVRMTHIPTGIIVTCQDERSQIKNRDKAMKLLRSKLYSFEQQKIKDSIDSTRKNQIGSGDRSEKIRTYNYPQGRVTDHRIGLTLHKLEQVMQGDFKEIIDSLISFDQAEKLRGAL